MPQGGYELDVTLTGHNGTITSLRFSPDCNFLASGSDRGVLLVFSTSSWRPLKQLIGASPITTMIWHDTERYLLLCGYESGDLLFLNLSKTSEITVDSMSCFGGPIRSLSFSPVTPTLAISYGEEVSIAGIKFNPHGLDSDKKLLPRSPPQLQLPARGSLQLVAVSLHFLEKRNRLIVTYLNYGIVCWDLSAMSIVGRITPTACLIGRSTISRDYDTIAASNLIDGVDWYSLSSFKLISSSKVPISKSPSASPLTFVDGGRAIVVGGLSGQAYIVDCQTFKIRQELDHNDRRGIESVAFSPASGNRELIATGTIGPEGAAPINIWVSTSGGNIATLFTMMRNIDVKGFSWSGGLVYSTLLFFCYAWAAHFLTAG